MNESINRNKEIGDFSAKIHLNCTPNKPLFISYTYIGENDGKFISTRPNILLFNSMRITVEKMVPNLSQMHSKRKPL